jgi:hypothetical protein
MEQAGDRSGAAAHPPADLRHRVPFQVVQLQGRPLIVGKSSECFRQTKELLSMDGVLAGGGPLVGQPRRQAGRGLLKGRLQGPPLLPCRLARAAGQVDELASENRPQPAQKLGLAAPAKLAHPLVGPQHGLLDEIGRIGQGTESSVQTDSG